MKILRFVQAILITAFLCFAIGCGASGSPSVPPTPTPTPPPQPQLSISPFTLPPALVGTPFSLQLAAVNGTPPYTWTMSPFTPSGLQLSSSGQISGTPSASFCDPSTLTVKVQDSSAPAQTATEGFPFQAAGGYVSMDGGQVDVFFQGVIIMQCATEPVTWSLVSGALPPGLQMQPFPGTDSQLNFPGTPAQAGTFPLTVQGKDGSNRVIQESVSVRILPVPLKITDNAVMQIGVVNRPFDHTVSAAGGSPPYIFTISSGSLAAGLQLNRSTGELSGSPAAAGYFQFSIQVKDQTTPTQFGDQKSYTMLVTPAPLPPRNDSLATATPIFPGTYTASLSPYTDSSGNAAPDQDYYSLTGNGGDTFSVSATAFYIDPKTRFSVTPSTDPTIELLDSTGTRMATCKDPLADNPPPGAPFTKGTGTYTDACVDHNGYPITSDTPQSLLTVKLPPGSNQVFYIHVFDFKGRARPDFIYTLGVTKLP